MASTTFGATIVPATEQELQPQRSPSLLPPAMAHSPAITPQPSRESLTHDYGSGAPVQSPFYTHPPASHEAIPAATKKSRLDVYEKDLESGNDAPLTPLSDDENPFSKRLAVDHNKECTMWPSKQTLKQKYQAEKQKRRQNKGIKVLNPIREKWTAMSSRSKLIAKIMLALFIVGVAVALGVGISAAVKGTYYVGSGSNRSIET